MSLLNKDMDIRMTEPEMMVALGFHDNSIGGYWKTASGGRYSISINRAPSPLYGPYLYSYQCHRERPFTYPFCEDYGTGLTLTQILNKTEKYWK